MYNSIVHIRDEFARKFELGEFVTDKTGVKCVEIINASFIANEETIFGATNKDYIERELNWYLSTSLFVKDIPGNVPKIWQDVASNRGKINSNYGWAIYSEDNHHQYLNCLQQLVENKDSRRACMIYNRPSMQYDYKEDGMSDFMCTYSVQYMIRDNKLHAFVYMRSNDSIFGYRNDYAWQEYVFIELFKDLLPTYPELQTGEIFWNAASLHIYERHFNYIEKYIKTGEIV